jgi:hypothetical protein
MGEVYMRIETATIVIRLLILSTSLVIGSVVALIAYENGSAIHREYAIWFGLGWAGVVVMSWLLGGMYTWLKYLGNKSLAIVCMIIWIPMALFSIANSIMYVGESKTMTVDGKQKLIDAYDTMVETKNAALEDLRQLKLSQTWTSTSGCTDSITSECRRLLKRIQLTEDKIDKANTVINDGKPSTPDAGAELLAWVFRIPKEASRKIWTVAAAIMLEVGATWGMKLALSPWIPVRTRVCVEESSLFEKKSLHKIEPDNSVTTIKNIKITQHKKLTETQLIDTQLEYIKSRILSAPNKELVITDNELREVNLNGQSLLKWLIIWRRNLYITTHRQKDGILVKMA